MTAETTELADLIAQAPKRHESNVSWDRLHEHPANPRRGDVSTIEESLRSNGWFGVVVAQESTGNILVGNHRSRAARNIGLPFCPDVQWLDVDDDTALRILAIDNRAADLAYYEDRALADLLTHLMESDEGLAGTGFGESDYELVLQNLAAAEEGSHGSVGSAPTPGERADAWEATDIRSVILPYPGPDYDAVVDGLIELRNRWGLDTNAEVVAQLVKDARG